MPLVRPSPLSGWTVLSLRPRGQHASLRHAAARRGARTLALSVLTIQPHGDAATRRALAAALKADICLFSSPNAVRAAHALQSLLARHGRACLAVGTGTRQALQRLGIASQAPKRMDSEGLLALPVLADLRGRTLGLVSGQDGRGMLASALRARGATVLRADVYARKPVVLGKARITTLDAALRRPRNVLLVLSSAETLSGLLAQIEVSRLRDVAVVAASPRLAQHAREAGFTRLATAASARPSAMLRAATDAFA